MNCKKIAIRALVALLCATMLIGMIPLYVSAADEILVEIGTATVDKATATVTTIADGEFAGDYYIVDIPVTITQNTDKGFYMGLVDMDVEGTDIVYHSYDMTGALFTKKQFKGAVDTADAAYPTGVIACFVKDGDEENHTGTGLLATIKYMVPTNAAVGEYAVKCTNSEFVPWDVNASAFTPSSVTDGKIIVKDSSAKAEPKIFTPDTFNFGTGVNLSFAKNTDDATYDFVRVSGTGAPEDNSRFIFNTDVEISKLPVMRVVYKSNTSHTFEANVWYTGISTLTGRLWGPAVGYSASETWTDLYLDFSSSAITGGDNGSVVKTDYDWSKVEKMSKCAIRLFGTKGNEDATGKNFDIAYIGFFADKASAEAYKFEAKTPAAVTPVAMYDKENLKIVPVSYFASPVYNSETGKWTLVAAGEQNANDNFAFDVKFTDLLFKDAKYAKFGIKISGGTVADSNNINCGVNIPTKKADRLWAHGTAMSSAKDTYKELVLVINDVDSGYKLGNGITGDDARADADTTIEYLRFKPFGTSSANVVTDGTVEFTYIAFFNNAEDAANYVYTSGSEPEPETYTVTFMADGAEFAKLTDVAKDTALTYPTTTPTKEGYTFKGWDVAEGTKITADLTVNAIFEEDAPAPSAEPAALIPASSFKSVNGMTGWNKPAEITTADGKSYWHFTAVDGTTTGDMTRIYTYFNLSDFAEGFKFSDNKFVKIGYRGSIADAASALDVNPMPYNEGKNTRLWGGQKPAQTLNGEWQTLVFDASTFTGGENLAVAAGSENFFEGNCSGAVNGICFKPQGANGKVLTASDYYDVLYVAFFSTKEAAEAYVYTPTVPAETYTVTFMADGAEFAKLTDVAKDTALTYPVNNPTKEGYTFKGWDVAEGTKITADLTVNAIFEEIPAVTPVAIFDQDTLNVVNLAYFNGSLGYDAASKTWKTSIAGSYTTVDDSGIQVNFTNVPITAAYAKIGIKVTGALASAGDNINVGAKGNGYDTRFWAGGTNLGPEGTFVDTVLDITKYTSGEHGKGYADLKSDANGEIKYFRIKPWGNGPVVTDPSIEIKYVAFFNTLEDANNYVYTPTVPVEYVTVTFMADGKVYEINDKQVKGAAITYPAKNPTKADYTFKGWDVPEGTIVNDNITVNANFEETPVTIGDVIFNARQLTLNGVGGLTGSTVAADGKVYAHFEASAGKSGDNTRANVTMDQDVYPKGFTMLNHKFVKIGYRSNIASSNNIDFNVRPVDASVRVWGAKVPYTNDGNWNTVVVDLSAAGWSGGEKVVGSGKDIFTNNFDGTMVAFVIKPYQSNNLAMISGEYFDIEYIGFFDSEDAANAYVFPGIATVTIKVEGSSDITIEANAGEEITLPAAPDKAGYRFTGYVDEDDNHYDAGDKFNAANTTLTAQYEVATEYYVDYYDEDGTTLIKRVTVPADNAKYSHIAAPTKDGFKFTGWTIKGTSTVVYSGDKFVGDKELVANYKAGSSANDLSTLINVLKIIKVKKSGETTKPSGTTESKVLDAKLYTAAQLAGVYQENENFASAGLKTINGVEYAAYTAKPGTYGDDGLNLIFKLEDIADGQKFVDYPVIKFGYYSTASFDAVEPNVIASYQGQNQRTWGASAGTVNGKFAEIVYNYSTALTGNNAGSGYSFSNFDADGTVISPCFKAWGSQTLNVSGKDETFAIAYIAFFKNEADAKSYEFGKTVIGEATETPAEEKPAAETKPAEGAVATYTAEQLLTVSTLQGNISAGEGVVSADGTSYASYSAPSDGASDDNTKIVIKISDLGADFNIKDYPFLAVSYKSNIGVDTTIDFNMQTSYQGSVLRIWGARIDFKRNDKKTTMVIDLANAFTGGEGAAGQGYAWANVDANGICNALWFKPWGGSGGKEMKAGEYFMIEKLAFFADKASAEAFN